MDLLDQGQVAAVARLCQDPKPELYAVVQWALLGVQPVRHALRWEVELIRYSNLVITHEPTFIAQHNL